MKLALAAVLSLLQVWSSRAFMTDHEVVDHVRNHPRSLLKRDGRDCGKFVMDCSRAQGACNNACYHVNCIDENKESMKMVYDEANNNKKNRENSGCQPKYGRSVCNVMPFSQRLHDPFNSDPGNQDYNCDEWPMATLKQDDFKEGTIRNSLRCIKADENSSGGSQLENWIEGSDSRDEDLFPKKTCSGKVKDGDFWTVDFRTDDVENKDDVKNCIDPDCDNDQYAFHMTKKQNHLTFPWNPDRDNHYSLARNQPDLNQCRIVVHKHGPDTTATVYDETKAEKGTAESTVHAKGDWVFVEGLAYGTVVYYTDVEEMPFQFQYGGAKPGSDEQNQGPLKYFVWDTKSKGTDKDFQDDGSYCKRQSKGSNEVVFECYFPCVA